MSPITRLVFEIADRALSSAEMAGKVWVELRKAETGLQPKCIFVGQDSVNNFRSGCRRFDLGLKRVWKSDLSYWGFRRGLGFRQNEGSGSSYVVEGSPAECAGILNGDVIVRCAGKDVGSFLEFCGRIWDKKKESVKLVVIRATSGDRLKLKLKLEEASPDKFYQWPLPEECWVPVKRTRI
ncbi:hypothetical protein Vadar_004790 [Vaccinium darrowii]|uniref:Uncharacterized protein n=1 Tax=Vaccinium darrowii TaxID=229202 RepID=A0ACB7YTC4_9ERIC|nr:hypothetical protein Vadar_004790 [Vaccinium darrowii]